MKKVLTLIVGIMCLLAGCAGEKTSVLRAGELTAQLTLSREKADFSAFALDTLIRVQLWGEDTQQAAQAMLEEIERLESLFSVTDPQSDIARMNAAGGAAVIVEKDTADLLSRALALWEQTEGAFDPALYRVKCAWGWPDDPRVPGEGELAQALAASGAQHLTLDHARVSLGAGAQCDLGGIAKGYIADRLHEIVLEYEVAAALIDLGGNIQTVGDKPDGTRWAVGIRDPQNPSAYAGILRFSGSRAVVTSGAYERYFEEDGVRWGHILNPQTGYPVQGNIASVTIVTQDAALGDALSTAAFVMGDEKSFDLWQSRQDFGLVMVKDTGDIIVSEDVTAELETKSGVETVCRGSFAG